MTGSVMDGEDVVQDALFQAYRKLDTFDDKRPLAPGSSCPPGGIVRNPPFDSRPSWCG